MKQSKTDIQNLCRRYLDATLDHNGEQLLHRLLCQSSELTEEQAAVLMLLEACFPHDAEDILEDALSQVSPASSESPSIPSGRREGGYPLCGSSSSSAGRDGGGYRRGWGGLLLAAAAIALLWVLWPLASRHQQESGVPVAVVATKRPQTSSKAVRHTRPARTAAVSPPTGEDGGWGALHPSLEEGGEGFGRQGASPLDAWVEACERQADRKLAEAYLPMEEALSANEKEALARTVEEETDHYVADMERLAWQRMVGMEEYLDRRYGLTLDDSPRSSD